MAPRIYDYKEFYRRKLPHFHPFGATLFITFRLHGSVPKVVVRRWQAERELLEKQLSRRADSWTDDHEGRVKDFHRRWFREFEEMLHRAACGPTWLKDERIAQVVADSLRHRDGTVYCLDAYCIMSNHVHVVFTPRFDWHELQVTPGSPVCTGTDPPPGPIMHSLKSYTAQEANKVLGRTGPFWDIESYDHAIRDEDEYDRIIAYVLNNPVKAGLVRDWREWRWTWWRNA